MYKNNRPPDNTRFFFVVVAVIASVLIIVALIASNGALFQRIHPNDTLPTTSDAPISDNPTEDNTSAPDTSEPVTATDSPATEPPATDPVTTEPPVTDPVTTYTPEVPPIGDYVLGETADAGIEYQDQIIFLGDSTTYSLLYYGVLSGGKESLQVWTPKSRTLSLDRALTTTILYPDTEDEITIEEAVSQKKPEIMVITLGVNGISYMYDKEEYFISVYTKLVNKIKEASPDTKIILQSIYPVARSWEKTKSINNERIRTANGWIRRVAEDCGIHYLDTISVLADAEGFLPEAYQNGDGLHLNADSCRIVLNYIRTHALPEYVAE